MATGSSTYRPRRLVCDDVFGTYSLETRSASAIRICAQRHKRAEAVNRGEQLKLESECHEYEKKHRLFSMHLSTERSAGQHALKELVAHRHVLTAIANNNMRQPDYDDKFGRYGEGAYKFALQPQIEAEKLRMDPMQRRKAMCKLLLQQRRQRGDVQRSLTTEHTVSRWAVQGGANQSSTKGLGRLMVPPIHAKPLHRSYDSPRKENTAGDKATAADQKTTSKDQKTTSIDQRTTSADQRTITTADPTRNLHSTVFITQKAITKI